MAARFDEGGTPDVRVEKAVVEVGSGYIAEKGLFSNKFEFVIQLLGDDDVRVARFEFDLVVDYRIDPEFEPTEDAAIFVAGTTGYFAAYPYAREILHSMSSRLRIDPVVLGFLKKRPDGSVEMRGVNMLRRPERGS